MQVSPHASILRRPVPSRPVYPAGRDGTGRVFSKDHGIAATLTVGLKHFVLNLEKLGYNIQTIVTHMYRKLPYHCAFVSFPIDRGHSRYSIIMNALQSNKNRKAAGLKVRKQPNL